MSNVSSIVMIDATAALEIGDSDRAERLLEPVLKAAPDALTARCLMGRSAEVGGDLDQAERHYQMALATDPRDGEVYGGLGRIAWSRGERQAALAYHQVAWELAPWDVARRERLVEIASEVLGAEGQLQWTRAALANQHLAQGRLERATLEFQRALAALPGRVDLQAGLAQVVWMLGDDLTAGRMARDLLADRPRAILGLVLLTDIEQRRGELELAAGYGARLRELDPDGVLSAGYADLRSDAERGALLAGIVPLGVVDETPVDEERVEVAAVGGEEPGVPAISGSVLPIEEGVLPADFPAAPDIAPAYRPTVADVVVDDALEGKPEVVEELVDEEPDVAPEEDEESDSPVWPASDDEPPAPKLPSNDAIAAMLGVLREKRYIEE